MTLYVHKETGRYPYTTTQLLLDNPQISFPKYPDLETLFEYGVFPVTYVEPVYDQLTQILEPTGCAYNDKKLRWETTFQVKTKPPPEIPQIIARSQGKAALILSGYYPGVLSYVASIEDPLQRELSEVALHDTQQWSRTSPFLNSVAIALQISDSELDNLFLLGSQIEL